MEPEQVRNIMDSMIRKLYDMELEEQGRSDWQNGSIAEEGKRYLKEHFLLDISEYDGIPLRARFYREARWHRG